MVEVQQLCMSATRTFYVTPISGIVNFTVVCLVMWPMNESEAGVDLVLIETSLLFLFKFLLTSITTTTLT